MLLSNFKGAKNPAAINSSPNHQLNQANAQHSFQTSQAPKYGPYANTSAPAPPPVTNSRNNQNANFNYASGSQPQPQQQNFQPNNRRFPNNNLINNNALQPGNNFQPTKNDPYRLNNMTANYRKANDQTGSYKPNRPTNQAPTQPQPQPQQQQQSQPQPAQSTSTTSPSGK